MRFHFRIFLESDETSRLIERNTRSLIVMTFASTTASPIRTRSSDATANQTQRVRETTSSHSAVHQMEMTYRPVLRRAMSLAIRRASRLAIRISFHQAL